MVCIILFAILTLGAVNASENTTNGDLTIVEVTGDYGITPEIEEINIDSDISNSSFKKAISDNAIDKLVNEKNKLGVSNEDMLGEEIITPSNINEFIGGSVPANEYKFAGDFDSSFPYLNFDEGCIVDASEAKFINMGIILNGNVQINGLTMSTSRYLEDDTAEGALIYVTGDNNILNGLKVDYTPESGHNVYGIVFYEANNFQLLNSVINFTGVNLGEFYEYAMKIDKCEGSNMVRNNSISAMLPILDVDFSIGNPSLNTDLVLNTGIRDSQVDLIGNKFYANVIDKMGDHATLDCIMLESCENVNIINNTLNETDFITPQGVPNFLNVLDLYYSSNILIQNNNISVETAGGSDHEGTSYPIQLTGPYENVVIDGNSLYAHCGGPALGIYSQNNYGNTELLVENNKIDITGLPTEHNWGLVSGIEVQDNFVRIYNNDIKTQSVTGSYENGTNLFGISYAQQLNENHKYDIQGNTIETQGKYTVYLLKAQDTTVTGNFLVSSTGVGDETVQILSSSGNTVVSNNYGRRYVITKDNVFDYFDQSNNGALFDFVPEGAVLDFQGEIKATEIGNLNITISKPVNLISSTHDSYIDLNTTAGSLEGESPGDRFTVNYGGSGSNVTGIFFHNTQLWISNTTNVVLDNVSSVVENQKVGSGVGTVSVRDNSSYVTVKNSYFYTEDNGGSSTLVLAWANHCTFDNNTIEGRGNIGNMMYSTTYNVYTAPEGYPYSNDYNIFKNNVINNPGGGGGMCQAITVYGSHNIIDNNTVNGGTGIHKQWGTGEEKYNNTYSNNKIYNGNTFETFKNSTVFNNIVIISRSMSLSQDSIGYNNTVSGSLSVGYNVVAYNNTVQGSFSVYTNATAYDNIVNGETTIDGSNIMVNGSTLKGVTITKKSTDVTLKNNNIAGAVEVKGSGNEIIENTINSNKAYAVNLGTTVNNTVSGNILYSSNGNGNNAIRYSSQSNTIGVNYPSNVDVIYVSTTGLDTNDGSSRETAVASLTHAIQISGTGKIVILNGNYTFNQIITVNKNLDIIGEDSVNITTTSQSIFNNYAQLNLTNLKFINSNAITSIITNQNTGILSVEDCEFMNNAGSTLMTSLIYNLGNLTVENAKFIGNTLGMGSIWNANLGNAKINNCEFKNNKLSQTNYQSSAILIESGVNVLIENSIFENNANANGAVTVSEDNAIVSIVGCNFTDNPSKSKNGNSIAIFGSAVGITESSFITSGDEGSSIYVAGGVADISDSVILQDNGYALVKANNPTITANDNWWGDNTKPNT